MLNYGPNGISALYFGSDIITTVYLGAQLVYSKHTTLDIGALVAWKDDDDAAGMRPSSVTVHLFRDGEVYDSKELSAENNWRATWGNLSSAYQWQLTAEDPDGYQHSISLQGSIFVVEYTYVEEIEGPEDPDIPLLDDPI